MNPETIDAIQKALAPIAEKIGQSAAFGWDVVVQQQKVIAVTDLIWAPLVAVIAGVCWWAMFKYTEKTDGMSLWLVVPAVFFTIWVMFNIDEAITHLLNPAYYALQFFITLGKPN